MTTLALLATLAVHQAAYDPTAVFGKRPQTVDLALNGKESGRQVPIRVYLPATKDPAPVVFFSHGLGGNREGNAFMGEHWAKRGYVAVFLQHPGSDDGVWKNERPLRRMAAMKRAASAENFLHRVNDVPAVLDGLATVNDRKGHVLFGRLNLDKVGMSGHSFGAVTTQAVAGQSFPGFGARFTDQRIDAAIAFSPNNPRKESGPVSFGAVKIPWMLMTGTKDTAMIGDATVESRLDVFPNLPSSIDRYQIVLDNAEHSAFTERALPGDREQRNPNHHRAILALSTAFWDAYLRGDRQALDWLQGPEAKRVLQSKDQWEARAKGS